MHQMTGGSLPAQTWKEIMAFAHQGVELRQIPGVGPNATTTGRFVADSDSRKDSTPIRPTVLTRRGTDVLVRVERMMEDATRALANRGEPNKARQTRAPATDRPETVAKSDQPAGEQVRGH
jgi:penicillin-binding protein 1A